MKKRTKISLRTKIYLTIVGLLALTGVLYAANPSVFVMPGNGVFRPISPAVTQTHFYVSQYENGDVKTVDCNGMGSTFGTLPIGQVLVEKYMAFAPANAVPPFVPGDLFVTVKQQALRATPPVGIFMPFADWSGVDGGCPTTDHSSLTFDKVGTFGNKMIITCEQGRVFLVDGSGGVTHLADTTTPAHGETFIEGPAVLPLTFGPLGGQIMVADDQHHQLYTINNLGTVNYTPFGFPDGTFYGAEQILVIPQFPCTYCGDRAFFVASAVDDNIVSYPPSDFAGLGGDILIPSELNPNYGMFRVHFDVPSQTYQFSSFDVNSISKEGSSFVDGSCPPTPTATPTFTPTPSATFTPTPSATFTPTPSATFTPTPSATSTPTPTPTSTGSCNPLASCTPPYPFVCPSGHPCPSSSPARTNVAFNESTVLKCFRTTVVGDCNPTQIQVFYNDEHALTLGVRQINNNGIITNYPVSPLTMDPDSAYNPATGATEAQGGVDTSFRPMFPAIFVTDLSVAPGNTNELAGDWQYGGTGQPPNFVSGTWKAAVRTVTGSTVTVTPDNDPPKNDWNLGPGADPVCSPTPQDEGYGAEVRWDISQVHDDHNMPLQPGHRYRLYFMVHDGDQNKTGGDSGQGCSYITLPSVAPSPTPTPTPTPTPIGTITVTNKVFSAKTVQITFQNGTTSSQVLNALQMTWPQATNGNLQSVTMGATTIYNKSTGGGNFISFSLSGTAAQRTIATGGSATLTFTFQNNVNTTAANYTGTATFSPFGPVTYLP